MTGPKIDQDLSPVIAGMLSSAREFLAHEHSLFRTLGLRPLLVGRGRTSFALDLPPEFADATGSIHGGLTTIVLDSIMGLTVYTSLDELTPIATVNLRIDRFGRTPPGRRAVCACETVAIVDEVAHVSGRMFEEAGGALLASGTGAFMVGTRGEMRSSRL